MRQKLLNCCRPEQVSTKEYGKMLKRIQILEDGRVPAKEAKDWKIEGKKMRITRKEYKRLINLARERKDCRREVPYLRKKVM